MKRESTKPISPECAAVIKEQQNYIREHFIDSYEFLFCAREPNGLKDKFKPKAKLMLANSFSEYLNKLANDFNISTVSGKKWHFQTHQFRHTVGTRMINNGVPQHIVQRYLDHDSPIMTSVYAHIHEETLRKEIEKFYSLKVIDITGQAVNPELDVDENDNDLEWFTKKIAAVALPNGYCARPKVLGDCTIPGDIGCYACPYFRTNKSFLDVHKEHLERVGKVLEKARRYNWQLPISKNEPIQENLQRIISVLEVQDDE